MLAAQSGIGRTSVLRALSGDLSELATIRIIPRHVETRSHSHNTALTKPAREGEDERLNSQNRNYVLRGRKPNGYRVPTHSHLQQVCRLTDEGIGSYDPLDADDLKSERAYRLALHRELIRRTTPELAYQWHAQRLHVCKRTVQHYNRLLGVVVTPIIGYELLTWSLLNQSDRWPITQTNVNQHVRTPGRWLQTSQGQRMPAVRGIAAALLAQSQRAILCRQLVSRFQLSTTREPLYECVWRRLDGRASDWGGGLYDDPLYQPERQSLITSDKNQETRSDQDANLAFIEAYNARPDDLTLIKGLGKWRAERLNQTGITQYRQLAQADAARLAGLSQMQYVTVGQAAFWIDQARVLTEKLSAVEDLKHWSYRDWRVCQIEAARISGARLPLKEKLAAEFHQCGWLKYHVSLPPDFIAMMTISADSRA